MKKNILAIVLIFVLLFTSAASAQSADTSDAALGAVVAVILGLGVIVIIFALIWCILQIIADWKILTKAGKSGWLSLIPIVNNWNVVDLSWNRLMAWVIVLGGVVVSFLGSQYAPTGTEETYNVPTFLWILTVVLMILNLIANYKLAKAFGKGFGFFLGLVFLNPIFKLILGLGGSRYEGRQG